jgi:hypothetical protein
LIKKGILMKYSTLFSAMLVALAVSACEKPATVVAVPGPAGPTGATGATGNTGDTGATGERGKTGRETVVIVPVPRPATEGGRK